jgi:transposase InsO family protein
VKTHPFIEAEKLSGRNVARTCELLEVSRAAFYARHSGVPSKRKVVDATLTAEIRQIHATSKGSYGSPRIHSELVDNGNEVGRRRITRLMREAEIVGLHKRRWRKTTVVDPAAERARDLIQRDFAPGPATDRRYVGDITYIATWEGFAYLATVIDLASRRVVGWAIANHMRTQLVEDALKMAFVQRRPSRGVIFHTDRGSQTGLNWSSQHLDEGGVDGRWIKRTSSIVSDGRAGRQLRVAITIWIERTYHRRRRQRALGRMTPVEFEIIDRALQTA